MFEFWSGTCDGSKPVSAALNTTRNVLFGAAGPAAALRSPGNAAAASSAAEEVSQWRRSSMAGQSDSRQRAPRWLSSMSMYCQNSCQNNGRR